MVGTMMNRRISQHNLMKDKLCYYFVRLQMILINIACSTLAPTKEFG